MFIGADRSAPSRLTYAELRERSERVARALLGRFDPGERIAVWAPNALEWVVLEFAAALSGLTLITVNPGFGADELETILGRADACGLFWGTQVGACAISERVASALPRLRETLELARLEELASCASTSTALPEVSAKDLAQIQHTSGTTGLPKSVLLTHGSIIARARIGAALGNLGPHDRMINPMPMFHTSGCNWMALGSVISGAAHVLLPGFSPYAVLHAIESERGTTLVGFATMLQSIVEHVDVGSYDLSSLRYVVSGGTSVPTPLARRIEHKLGARLSVLYGMTECSGVITQTSVEDSVERIGTSVGRPFPETDLKIIDPATGSILPVGEIGEICVRGELVMRGYLGAASPIDSEGWLHTGDFGSMDAEGWCEVEGRRYDLLLRDKRYVSPRPLEERLASHPAVAEVVVIALEDERDGHFVATVRPVPGGSLTVEELRAHASIVDCEQPARWILVERLPLTGTGKVHRYQVHRQLSFAGDEVVGFAGRRDEGA